ncbi:MAG: oxidoreductase [Halomonadaceae bacterium]|jgi:NAD(P)-dependent dehydrogenase (short-subunit alcohol dehydrogenase family)
MLSNKTILVAGAGGLLGNRLVEEALAQGAKVIAADIDVEAMHMRLKKQEKYIERGRLFIVEININDKGSIQKLFAAYDDIDGAVNTVYPRNKSYGAHFFDVSLASFNENLSLHLGAYFLFSQQCAAYFKRKSHCFSLVNISSIYGVAVPDFGIYANTKMTVPVEYVAIKSGIIQLSKYIVSYVNDSRFRINCVSPGGIYDGQPESFLMSYKNKTHGTGLLNSEDIVGTIVFLLSDCSRYITGQNILVDDGFSL